MEYMKLKEWGDEYKICAEVNQYVHGNGLAIELLFEEDGQLEPYADLTVNLPGYLPGKNRAFVDVSNFHSAPMLIEEYKLGKPTGRVGYSGYCIYPEYEFDRKELNKYCINPLPEREKSKKSRDEGR